MSDSSPILAPHYGLNTTPEGITYLVQSNREDMTFVGLPPRRAFRVKLTKAGVCPHNVPEKVHRLNADSWKTFLKYLSDDLVKDMLPIPKETYSPIPIYQDIDGSLTSHVMNLSRMVSPTTPLVITADSVTLPMVLSQLKVTNIAPLVIKDLRTSHQNLIDHLAQQAPFLPRKLILIALDDHLVVRNPLKRFNTNLSEETDREIFQLPMESIGLQVLQKHVREEPIYDSSPR